MNSREPGPTTPWVTQLLAAMHASDRAGAAGIIDAALAAGMPAERILADLLDPALAAIGREWEGAAIPMAEAFVAAKIAEDVLLRCMPGTKVGAARPKGPIVLGNIEDDFHSLGRRIVAVFLTAAGWEVHDLGNDVLPEQFLDRAVAVGARVIGVSAMMQTTALNIRKLRALIDARELRGRVRLAVGGAVFNWRPELVAEVGGEGTATNAGGVDAMLSRLVAEMDGGPSR